ncbi:endonuclease/exonuclease/phosphatase family protein [Cognatiyoonia sp. IB215446]|uniref:endonuclease/exonuclease/phosphatase family protein n=1 Tax=Cognatiyoonia sp. IB215446 TaxID=3097355 RepID=UPI002A104EBB|nr:endonuclease/exonuclease/phosphatase family protein [Cognatiyoonia sp. IB215446]MDX8347351.1 endonuclease/exonuclease/phosphatase family protein [Cognatiyoonia sp. IB215446]
MQAKVEKSDKVDNLDQHFSTTSLVGDGFMGIRALFWNIENFRGDNADRTRAAAEHIRAFDPHIVGFSEIGSKRAIRNLMMEELSDFDFGITDGIQAIELMAGWKRGFFEQALYTQRREFKAGSDGQRPGALLSVKHAGSFLNFLFLHTDSGRGNRDYENRREMFGKISKLRRALNDIEGGTAKFVVMGDLNTMGRDALPGEDAITSDEEITGLARFMARGDMTLYEKSHPTTFLQYFSNGTVEFNTDLDHVIASDVTPLADLGGGKKVRVRGWNDLATDNDRKVWTETLSDHASVEIEIDL